MGVSMQRQDMTEESAVTAVRDEYIVLGPSKAGKTALLATLACSVASIPLTGEKRFAVNLVEPNDAMRDLTNRAARTPVDGILPMSATERITELTFTLLRPEGSPRWWPWRRRRLEGLFRWLDGPGGAVFELLQQTSARVDAVVMRTIRDALVQQLRHARGIILCLDATDPSGALPLFRSLPELLRDTRLRELPCQRVAICLTKADAHFAREEHEAARADFDVGSPTPQQRLDAMPAVERLREIVPYAPLHELTEYCPNARFGLTWTSVYGFLENGEPNFDPMQAGLRHRVDPAAPGPNAFNRWKPFRVVDPFVWLLGARGTGMKEYSPSGLRDAIENP